MLLDYLAAVFAIPVAVSGTIIAFFGYIDNYASEHSRNLVAARLRQTERFFPLKSVFFSTFYAVYGKRLKSIRGLAGSITATTILTVIFSAISLFILWRNHVEHNTLGTSKSVSFVDFLLGHNIYDSRYNVNRWISAKEIIHFYFLIMILINLPVDYLSVRISRIAILITRRRPPSISVVIILFAIFVCFCLYVAGIFFFDLFIMDLAFLYKLEFISFHCDGGVDCGSRI